MNKKFIGIYDVFSAMIVNSVHKDLFLSGLSYTASNYGLPDIGFMGWEDVISTAAKIKSRCRGVNLLVDIDDGFGGAEIASFVVRELEKIGVWGVVLEDQARPKRCGHVEGKKILPVENYLTTLEAVVQTSRNLRVVARTDSTEFDEQVKRLDIFSKYRIYAALVDGVSVERYFELKKWTNNKLFLNYIHGGNASIDKKLVNSVDCMIFSTSCLGGAGSAVIQTVRAIKENSIFNNPQGLSLNEIRDITEKF